MVAAIAPLCKVTNSYLKYPGGKRKEVPLIRHLWQPYSKRRLVDLTAGSCGIGLGLGARTALMNDINQPVINLHSWVKRGLKMTLLDQMKNDRQTYYELRNRFNYILRHGDPESAEAAQLFYYLNRTGFRGIVRFSNLSGFNVSYGDYRKVNYIEDFSPWQVAFARWEFQCGDFETVRLKSGDFVIADSPYDSPPKREQLGLPGLEDVAPKGEGFTQYSVDDFGWSDQVRLVKFLSRHTGPVVLFNHATDRMIDLCNSHGFTITPIKGNRQVDIKGDRTPANDFYATRNLE